MQKSEPSEGGRLEEDEGKVPAGTLSFFSTTTIFGTPVDVTLSELALESFFPADPGRRTPCASFQVDGRPGLPLHPAPGLASVAEW